MIEGIIYKATNTINGQVYIGATTQLLENRKQDHISKALKGYDGYFQKSLMEYGIDSFEWLQIDTAQSENELAEKEVSYILEYDSKNEGYNKNKGGGFKKIIYQFSTNGELIRTFETLEEASNLIQVSKDSISHACVGDRNTCNGFIWNYTNTFILKGDSRIKKVEQFSLDNELINSFESIKKANEVTGINKTSIAKCCRGERNKAGGFIWKPRN